MDAASDFDILRRIAERGLALAQKEGPAFIDIFQHLVDEIERMTPTPRLTSEQAAEILRIRHDIRTSEGGGGMCSIVSECLSDRFGWKIQSGVYTSKQGEVICDAHVWNEMQDGTLIDATSDQFGEEAGIRIVSPDSVDYPRYRKEWYADWNPDTTPEDCPIRLGYSVWEGELDADQAKRLQRERGDGWWEHNPDVLGEYWLDQRQYEENHRKHACGM